MNGMMNRNIIIDVSIISSIVRTRGPFPTPIVDAVFPPAGRHPHFTGRTVVLSAILPTTLHREGMTWQSKNR